MFFWPKVEFFGEIGVENPHLDTGLSPNGLLGKNIFGPQNRDFVFENRHQADPLVRFLESKMAFLTPPMGEKKKVPPAPSGPFGVHWTSFEPATYLRTLWIVLT